jgi:hypothetical protein
MAMAESDQLVEVLKEIRDELRAVRTELAGRGAQMTTSGIRTEVVARQGRWRSAALAVGGVAGLALVLGLVMRDRPVRTPVAVAPPISAMPAMPIPAAMPPQAPVVGAAPVAAHVAVSATTPARPPAVAPTLATKPAGRLPADAPATAIASAPVPSKKRVKPDVAAKPPAEVASDEDEPIAFAPPPRRVRVHRLSYGPVGSEPAKL